MDWMWEDGEEESRFQTWIMRQEGMWSVGEE